MHNRKIFVTSDTHFGRERALDLFKRPFNNVEQMNNYLIETWNSVVGKNDIVYHLGNFAWDTFSANYALEMLNGNIYFMLGNRDRALLDCISMYSNCTIVPTQITELHDTKIVLCHYPLEDWNGKEESVAHLHGHTFNIDTDLNKMNRFNVMSDKWRFKPVLLSDIIEYIKEFNTNYNDN